MRLLLPIHRCHWLRLLALAGMVLLSFNFNAMPAYQEPTSALTWNLEMEISTPVEEARAMGGAEATGEHLMNLAQQDLAGQSVSTGVKLLSIGDQEITHQLTMQGSGDVEALRRMLFVQLDQYFDFLGGPVLLTIDGEVDSTQMLVMTLDARLSTGYSWKIFSYDPAMFEPVNEDLFQQETFRLGAPARQSLQLKVLKSGLAHIELAYLRPFEQEASPTRKLAIRVTNLPAQLDLSNPEPPASVPLLDLPQADLQASVQPMYSTPSAFDLRNFITMPDVRNQGNCGSCWAFGTVGAMEIAMTLKGLPVANLSEQYLVSCNQDGFSCNGGWWAHDYHLIPTHPYAMWGKNNNPPGAVLEADKPYTATNGTCTAVYPHPYNLGDWQYISGNTVATPSQIKSAILNHGPVATSVCVGSEFQKYHSGIFSKDEKSTCGGGVINHAVVLVGWQDLPNINSGYWIMRNSWGAGWGESGYMRIKWGTSNIGFGSTYVDYPSDACYSLNISYTPQNGGTVTADPAPNCNGTQYHAGTVVQLTAQGANGSSFLNWGGDLTDTSNPAMIIFNEDKNITAHFSEPPSNDHFANAIVIGDAGGIVNYLLPALDVSAASTDPTDPFFPNQLGQRYRSVWYRFNPAVPGTLKLSTAGSSYDTILGVWTGTEGDLTLVRWNDNVSTRKQAALSFSVIPGSTYWIEVASKTETAGQLLFQLTFTPKKASNNNILYATRIADPGTAFTYDKIQDVWSATTGLKDPDFGSYGPQEEGRGYRSVWYRFKPIHSGILQINTIQSNYDTLLGIYRGPTSALVKIGQDDNGGGGDTSLLSDLHLNGGVTYYIEIASFTPTGDSLLQFNLQWTLLDSFVPPLQQSYDYDMETSTPSFIWWGNWSDDHTNHSSAENGTLTLSTSKWDVTGLTFTGTRVSLSYARLPGGGVLQVILDGKTVAFISQSSAQPIYKFTWNSILLKPGVHTITLIHYGGTSVNVDAITLTP